MVAETYFPGHWELRSFASCCFGISAFHYLKRDCTHHARIGCVLGPACNLEEQAVLLFCGPLAGVFLGPSQASLLSICVCLCMIGSKGLIPAIFFCFPSRLAAFSLVPLRIWSCAVFASACVCVRPPRVARIPLLALYLPSSPSSGSVQSRLHVSIRSATCLDEFMYLRKCWRRNKHELISVCELVADPVLSQVRSSRPCQY